MRIKGLISSWNDEKGFGFIRPLTGGDKVFVHISAFGNRSRRPAINDVVTFSVASDERGRPRAAHARFAGDKLQKRGAQERSSLGIVFALCFLGAVGASCLTGHLPAMIGIAYVMLSPVTFMAYALDKSAAQRDAWRTAESTLHLLGLVGGWPGGLIAQRLLRHKSKKGSFRAVFWVTVVLNCAALLWLHTENGRSVLMRLGILA
jgi:uncharacterized membrane protein YsdA (DUF1294 family)/cold shock CspA family protein